MEPLEVTRETARVAQHLARAEHTVSRRPDRRLARAPLLKRVVRSLLLRELRSYRRAGVFPKNRDFPGRMMPYFIDADGTRCAMAHLLEVGGAAALVARIARERNNAFVRDLADEPELLAWLDAAGLGVDDAAAIQPSYCEDTASLICGSPDRRPTGALELTIVAAQPDGGVLDGGPVEGGRGLTGVTARVDATHGDVGGLVAGTVVLLPGEDVSPGPRYLVAVDRASVTTTDAGIVVDGLRHLFIERDSRGIDLIGHWAPHPLTTMQAVEAMLSQDCRATLVAIDPYFACGSPDDSPRQDAGTDSGTASPGATSTGADGGCSTAAAADASGATFQILVALVGGIAARRLARAR